MQTTKKANASNITKQIAIASIELHAVTVARRVARRNGARKMAQLLGIKS